MENCISMRTNEQIDAAYLRAHTVKLNEKVKEHATRDTQTTQTPYNYTLVFDTETTTDEKQSLRFGCYSLYEENELLIQGFFVSDSLPEQEKETIKSYARLARCQYLTKQKFVSLLYYYGHNVGFKTLIIGHNLFFDISRLSEECQGAKKAFENGFSLKLCTCNWTRKDRKRSIGDSCRYHPNIHAKKISPHAHLYEFSDRKPSGNFLDTGTLARALLGPGSTSLESLGTVLNVRSKKLQTESHGTQVTHEYLEYAQRDVLSTYEIYKSLQAIYYQYGFNKELTRIYSEASVGKALYEKLNIPGMNERLASIPDKYIGYSMVSYYGGRSEINYRHEQKEILYCDYKSEYPTVYSLMKLQKLLLAESYTVEDCTHQVQDTLQTISLDAILDKNSWPYFRLFCKISGNNLILPVRSKYNDQSLNIAYCKANLDKPVWYAFPDILAGILLNGNIPNIVEAFRVIPVGEIETQTIRLFEQIDIDLTHDDLFVSLINKRQELKQRKDEQSQRIQNGLKLLVNATSYGINIELNTVKDVVDLEVYGNDECFQVKNSTSYQQPGKYYNPVIGSLITSGGRLLLALAQALGHKEGLDYLMTDTDSISFVRPDRLSRLLFQEKVLNIQKRIQSLNPYSHGHLLEIEKENYNASGELTPLYGLCISPKRYALYNLSVHNGVILRKVSSHGLGGISVDDSYIPDIKQIYSMKELNLTNNQQWIADYWQHVIEDYILHGYVSSPYIKSLDTIAYHQFTVSTHSLYKRVEHLAIKPANFIIVFPGIDGNVYYHSFTRNMRNIKEVYSIKDNAVLSVKNLHTVSSILHEYVNHPNSKASNGFNPSLMTMRDVKIIKHKYIGKEGNGLENSLTEHVNVEYKNGQDDIIEWRDIKEKLSQHTLRELHDKTGMALSTLSRALARDVLPARNKLQLLRNFASSYV